MTVDAGLQSGRPHLTSLSGQVYDHLRRAIITAEIAPGGKLVELDIAAQMGTSQGPIREALQRLEHDGLVKRHARSATFVTSMSMSEMYELFCIRSVIEGFAIRHTVQTINADHYRLLDELVEKMALAGREKDLIRLAELDVQFHRHIVEWSGSEGLRRVWSPLASQVQRFIVQSHPEHYLDFVEIGTRHQPIADALRSGDADEAVRVMQEHIMLIWSRINLNMVPCV